MLSISSLFSSGISIFVWNRDDLAPMTLHELIIESGMETWLPIGHPERIKIGKKVKSAICCHKGISYYEYEKRHPKVSVSYSRNQFIAYSADEFATVISEIKRTVYCLHPMVKQYDLYRKTWLMFCTSITPNDVDVRNSYSAKIMMNDDLLRYVTEFM